MILIKEVYSVPFRTLFISKFDKSVTIFTLVLSVNVLETEIMSDKY